MSERPKHLDKAIAKFEKYKLEADKLDGLLAEKNVAGLLVIYRLDRPAFERMLRKWRDAGWSNWNELRNAVKRLDKDVSRVAKAGGALDEDRPMDAAKRFLTEVHPTLLRWREDFYVHRASHYVTVEDGQVRGDLWRFLDEADDGALSPNSRIVSNVQDALNGLTLKGRDEFEPPTWLTAEKGDPPAGEVLACQNTLLHLPKRRPLAHTPRLFTTNGLPFDYDPDAPSPKVFLNFLDELWGSDPEQITLLQEMFGYMLTPDTSQQKFFLLVGPTRSGRSTLVNLLRQLVGKRNTCALSFADLGARFGLENALGRSLATVGDLRLGKRADREELVSRLLSIVGEDAMDVDRKFKQPWTGKLGIRLVVNANELPALPDNPGALAARLVAFQCTESFLGREDRALGAKLTPELPGVLNWAIEGWQRLHEQGAFTETEASLRVVEEMRELGSPLHAFLREACEFDPEARTSKASLWSAYQWFEGWRGRAPCFADSSSFHRALLNKERRRISAHRPVVDGKQVPTIYGIRLLDDPPMGSTEGF